MRAPRLLRPLLGLAAGALLASTVHAGVDLVTLPARDAVQLTIYNAADLTLVRDQRTLTLSQGLNKLQYGWANTLIDPTSLELQPKAHADHLNVTLLQFLPRTKNLGLWQLQSDGAGKTPVEISYFTSGLSWRAVYQATLAADELTMRLQGYVTVTNGSGEDYEKASVRVVVGKMHLLDQIAALSRQQYPYGRPGMLREEESAKAGSGGEQLKMLDAKGDARNGMEALQKQAKRIEKEGLSEYFIYSIEGQETIPNGWSKRLPSLDIAAVPVENLYKYEEERYGQTAMRFLYFKNDEAHQLGQTPIPDGSIKICRTTDAAQHLSYEGQSAFKYIPVNQEAELNLGPAANVIVEPKVMAFRTEQQTFDLNGNVDGWDEVRDWQLTVKNTRDVAVRVAITRNLGTQYWTLKPAAAFAGKYEQADARTVKFTLTLPPRSQQVVAYTLTTRQGKRQEAK